MYLLETHIQQEEVGLNDSTEHVDKGAEDVAFRDGSMASMELMAIESSVLHTKPVRGVAHCGLGDDIGHVVDEGAEDEEDALLGEDVERLVALDAHLHVRLEGPLGRLLHQPRAAGAHVDLGVRAHKVHLLPQPPFSTDSWITQIRSGQPIS